MGKGVIVSGGADGLYDVAISYNRDRYNDTIAVLRDNLATLQAEEPDLSQEYSEALERFEAAKAAAEVCAETYQGWVSLYQGFVTQRDALQEHLNQLKVQLQDLIDNEADEGEIEIKQAEITAQEEDLAENEALISEAQGEANDAVAGFGDAAAEVQTANAELAAVQVKIDEHNLCMASIAKQIEYLENNMPMDKTVSAWCADLTKDLSGTVGTIEVPGERGVVQIQPGFFGAHAYDVNRDGQLFATVSMTAAQVFYNMAMFPGWQKWTPTFRHGVITAISGDYADVSLDKATSSLLDTSINRVDTLFEVEIEYMYCNGGAFSVDDEVLVMFSKTAEAQARFDTLAALKTELVSLLKEKAVLERGCYALSINQLEADLNRINREWLALSTELLELYQASPLDEEAIAVKEAETTTKQDEIYAKENEIATMEENIASAKVGIDSKQVEINDKKAAIADKSNEIKSNMADLAHPKIIGFKDHPKPCRMICPYIYCDGVFIMSRAGAVPFEFSFDDYEENNFKFLPEYFKFNRTQDYYNDSYIAFEDDNQTEWIVYPWMGSGGYTWDPVHYTQEDMESDPNYHGNHPQPYKYTTTTTVIADVTDNITEVGQSEDFGNLMIGYGHFTAYKRDDKHHTTYAGEISGVQVTSSYRYSTNIQVYSTGMSPVVCTNWQSCHEQFGTPAATPPDHGVWANAEWIYENVYGVAIDQSAPNKHAFLYSREVGRSEHESDGAGGVVKDIENVKKSLHIRGFGFDQELITEGVGDWVVANGRLYKIDSRYVYLFFYKKDINSGYYVGTLIEGEGVSTHFIGNEILIDKDAFKFDSMGPFGLIISGPSLDQD